MFAGHPSVWRGEDEWGTLGRSQTDPFFPSPPKGAHSCVMLGEQLDQGPGDKAAKQGKSAHGLSNPPMYLIKTGGKADKKRKQDYQSCSPPACLVCRGCLPSN